MNIKNLNRLGSIIAMVLSLVSCKRDPFPCDCKNGAVPTVKVFATGLNSPRGLKFGPDGNLYVAEAGTGGTDLTIGTCDQVPFPVGPYRGSATGGRISRINKQGARSTVTDKLPSSRDNEIVGGNYQGVSDVGFIGNNLYALIAGGGCSHGVPSVANGIVKIHSNGSWSRIADLSAWVKAHPVLHPEPGDFEPDGTPYSMITVYGDFYVVEPNHGDFIKVTPGGVITRFVDISASQGHIVPTAVAFNNGNFFVGNLHPFPVVPGSSGIYKIAPDGQVKVWLTGLTTVLGVTFDEWGRLYILQNSTVAGQGPTPGTGNIVRVDIFGNRETLISGLSFPTAMTFGPDGKLYVSNKGFGPGSSGGGEIVQVDLVNCVAPTTASTSKNF